MAADTSLGLMVDRRQPGADRPVPDALEVCLQLHLDEGDPSIHAWLIRARDGGPLPARIGSTAFGAQIRLMDRFYLPEVRDPGLVKTMFDIVADVYDELTTQEVNIHTARALLQEVLEVAVTNPLVLDFGCGTGLAAIALEAMDRKARLLGVDLSAAMLRRAAVRGEVVLDMMDWRRAPPRVDAAIAAFVLHYGVPGEDLDRIAGSLRSGGKFAANLFRATAADVGALERLLAAAGLDLLSATHLGGTTAPNVMLVFEKK